MSYVINDAFGYETQDAGDEAEGRPEGGHAFDAVGRPPSQSRSKDHTDNRHL